MTGQHSLSGCFTRHNLQRLDISRLSGAKRASPDEATAFWAALQNLEVLNLELAWSLEESESESEDGSVSVRPCFFQSVSAMTRLR